MAFLTIGCPTLLSSCAGAATNPAPVMTLWLDSPIQAAHVTESAPGIVTITGQMSIDKLPVERCGVSLRSSMDVGWPHQLSPTTAVFTSTTPQSFTCTVVVPQGTPQDLTGNLLIAAHIVVAGQFCTAEARGIISIDPYFRVELYSKQPFIEILPGEQAYFTYEARNTGNAVDSFEREILNLKELSDRHWTGGLTSGTLPKVKPGESKPDRVTVASPRHEQFKGDYYIDIVVKVTSQNAKDYKQVVSQNYTITIHVRSNWLPALSPYLVIIALSVVVAYLAVRLARERKRGAVSRLD